MYYTRHERNMQDAFCNFLHIARQMRHPRCSSPSYLYGSQFRPTTTPILSAPIFFIYRIRSSPCRKMTGASFPQGRAYGGQDTDLLQIHLSGLPKANNRSRMLLCTRPQVGCTLGSLRNQNSLYKRIPRLAESCKSGVFVSL